MNSPLHNLLTRIAEKKSQYDAKRPFPQMMEKSFCEASRIELTYHSNAIEGSTLTLAETALVIREGANIDGKKLREIYEARNHDRALTYIENLVSQDEIFTERDILHIHEIILRDIDEVYAGRYRDLPVRISGSMLVLPNPLKVPFLMQQFAESLANPTDNILEFAIQKHHDFLVIHPFVDGNGRTSRLIWNYFLLKNGYPLAYIDVADRPRYMNALADMDRQNPDALLILMLEATERSLDYFLENLTSNP